MNHNSIKLFSCPVCGGSLAQEQNSLRCKKNHCFDLAKSGYVNLFMNRSKAENYSKQSFQNRELVQQRGRYQPVLQAILEVLAQYRPGNVLLDAGCGNGYYSLAVSKALGCQMLAFDLSKDGVQIGSRRDSTHDVAWFVGDLAHIPLQPHCVDCVLDIFSPANYGEFSRVLKPGGMLIKVIPGERHLQELRQLASGQLQAGEYSSSRVSEYFKQRFTLAESRICSSTTPIDREELEAFVNMTPLLFHVNKESIPWEQVAELTIEAKLLIGVNRLE